MYRQSSGANKTSKDGSEDTSTHEQADKTSQPASTATVSDVVQADDKVTKSNCSVYVCYISLFW